jgi:hypothetical protein
LPPIVPLPTQPAGQVVVQSCIDGEFTGWSGDTAFELCNGQVWLQTSYAYTYHYAYRPDVTIGLLNGVYYMAVTGVNTVIAVTQATDFVKSCIDGAFDGWSGDTVFPLCNGQIWQQSSYAYSYHYAYRPDVLIYSSGFGYRMKVDGVDDTIAVTRTQ